MSFDSSWELEDDDIELEVNRNYESIDDEDLDDE